jgi:hypothetical protein
MTMDGIRGESREASHFAREMGRYSFLLLPQKQLLDAEHGHAGIISLELRLRASIEGLRWRQWHQLIRSKLDQPFDSFNMERNFGLGLEDDQRSVETKRPLFQAEQPIEPDDWDGLAGEHEQASDKRRRPRRCRQLGSVRDPPDLIGGNRGPAAAVFKDQAMP